MILNSGAAGGGGLSVIASGVLKTSTSTTENVALPQAAKFVIIQSTQEVMSAITYYGTFILTPGKELQNADVTHGWTISLDSSAKTLGFLRSMSAGLASFEYVAVG